MAFSNLLTFFYLKSNSPYFDILFQKELVKELTSKNQDLKDEIENLMDEFHAQNIRIDSLELDLRELRNKLIRLFGFDIDTVNVESKQGFWLTTTTPTSSVEK